MYGWVSQNGGESPRGNCLARICPGKMFGFLLTSFDVLEGTFCRINWLIDRWKWAAPTLTATTQSSNLSGMEKEWSDQLAYGPRGKHQLWLIGVVVCLLTAPRLEVFTDYIMRSGVTSDNQSIKHQQFISGKFFAREITRGGAQCDSKLISIAQKLTLPKAIVESECKR